MKAAPFDYARPETIDEACRMLAEAGGGATILAGGQTLMPLLALRMAQPFIVIDVNRIAELSGVTRGPDGLRIGPMTRQNDIIANELVASELPMLTQAMRHVGHHQTRNRGTIGGSIVFGEPAAENPATAVALGAILTIQSVRGTRRVPADAFYLGPYATVLEPDELLTSIDYPAWPAHSIIVFKEVAQRPGDFALVGLVGAVVLENGRIARAGLAWFGMGATPIKARQAESALVGQALADLDMGRLADLAIADTDPFDDHHASSEYRRTVGRRLFKNCLERALDIRQAA